MGNSDFATFPSSKNEALTMLYLQNQDLSNLTPEELADKYQETYDKIRQRNKEIKNQRSNNTTFYV